MDLLVRDWLGGLLPALQCPSRLHHRQEGYLGHAVPYLSIIFLYTSLYISWSLFSLTGFVKTIPRELDEAALIDGCRPGQLFFRIIFPLPVPVLTTNRLAADHLTS